VKRIASQIQTIKALPTLAKVGIIVGGYVAATLLAFCVVMIHQAVWPEVDASSGMYAFGETLLFVAVFGAVAIAPTALALFFLAQSKQ
jgi:hypothetical protein